MHPFFVDYFSTSFVKKSLYVAFSILSSYMYMCDNITTDELGKRFFTVSFFGNLYIYCQRYFIGNIF